MNIITRKVEDLIPYENNPRVNEKAVEKVASSIREFGFKVPIVIDKNNVIINGHTRIKACKKLGITEVPVIIADDLTEAQVKAFRIADNRTGEYAEWDMQKLEMEVQQLQEMQYDLKLTGLTDMELKDLIKAKTANDVQEDGFMDEVKTKDVYTKRGDIWYLGEHKLMCGSSTDDHDIDTLLDGEAADMVFTDLPYGVSYSGVHTGEAKKWDVIKNDGLRSDGLFQFLYEAFRNMKRIMKKDAAFYVFYASANHVIFEEALKENNLKVKQMIIWEKQMVLSRSDYHWNYEPCLYGCHVEQNCKWTGDRKEKVLWFEDEIDWTKFKKDELIALLQEMKDNSNIWDVKKDSGADYIHPTQKPLKLSAKGICNNTNEGEIVVDLFGGSGSTLMSTEQLNRKARLMELDEAYVELIVNRYYKFITEHNIDKEIKLIRGGVEIDFNKIKNKVIL